MVGTTPTILIAAVLTCFALIVLKTSDYSPRTTTTLRRLSSEGGDAVEMDPEEFLKLMLGGGGGEGGMDIEEEDESNIELGDEGDFLPLVLSETSPNSIKLRVPVESLNVPFIVHATIDKGSAPKGFVKADQERGAPAPEPKGAAAPTDILSAMMGMEEDEAESSKVFHFELSENGKSLQLVQHQFNTRTSDPDMKYTFDKGVWSGYKASFKIQTEQHEYPSADSNSSSSSETAQSMEEESEEPDSYLIDISSLVSKGFYVAGTSGSAAIQVAEARVFEKNSNILVHYQSSGTQAIYYSMMALPEEPWTKRRSDDRIGYFSHEYIDYGQHEAKSRHQIEDIDRLVSIINRRRLEKDESGRAINPIVYYIDPSVPVKWRNTFKQGVVAWEPAFRAAGFKRAIKAVAPEDPEWPSDYHLGDMRYNSISVMISAESVYAMGPSVTDPRSGEILHSDIIFAHSWFKAFVSEGHNFLANEPSRKRKHSHQCHIADSQAHRQDVQFAHTFANYKYGYVPEKMIHDAMVSVVIHEVGHTLGLRHNFAASTLRTPEQLQDQEYLAKYGVSASVMDYDPINVWSLMSTKDLEKKVLYHTLVSEYDIEAIKYGYKETKASKAIALSEDPNSPDGTYKDKELDRIAAAAPLYGSDEDVMHGQNPYVFAYDLSSDPISYYLKQVELAQQVRRNTKLNRAVPVGESWDGIWAKEDFALSVVVSTLKSTARFIGGLRVSHEHRNSADETTPSIQVVSSQDHQRVLEFFQTLISAQNNIFPESSAYVLASGPVSTVIGIDKTIQSIRKMALLTALSTGILSKLIEQEDYAQLSIETLFELISQAALHVPTQRKNYNIQMHYKKRLEDLIDDSDERIASVANVFYDQLLQQAETLVTSTDSIVAKVHFKKLSKRKPIKSDDNDQVPAFRMFRN